MKTAVQIFGYHHAEHNLEAVFLSFASLESTSQVSQISFL